MTDSANVFPPGFRVTDSAGTPVPGAILYFYDATTETPRPVYSDATRETPIGATVYCDSAGYPVAASGSTNKVVIWTDTGDYKVTAKTATGVEVWTHDNMPGALDTSGFGAGGGGTGTPTIPAATKTANYTVVNADHGTMLIANTTSANITLTLPSAVTMGNGWFVYVHKSVAANTLTLATVSSQTITSTEGAATTLAIAARGGGCILISNGIDWFAQGYVEAEISAQLASINTTLSGKAATSTTITAAGLATGGGSLAANRTITVAAATAAQMEAGTDAASAVTPSVANRHPGSSKMWVNWNQAGTAAIRADYGASSITDHGTGDNTVNFSTAFSSANYAFATGTSGPATTAAYCLRVTSTTPPAAGSIRLYNGAGTGSIDDATYASLVCHGDFT